MTRLTVPSEKNRRVLVLAGLLVGLGACGPLPPPPPPPPPPANLKFLIELGSAQTLTVDQLNDAHATVVATALDVAPGTEVAGAWYDKWLELLKRRVADSVQCYPVTYYSRDANSTAPDDTRIQLSGMLYLPRPRPNGRRPYAVPLLAYPHGTELLRDHVPSRNEGEEWVLGAAAALFGGFAVVMPDLPGMGGADPTRYHPYCHANSLAYSVVDAIRAMQEAFDTVLADTYTWDGHLYVMGYSEGGYAALATAKELQLNAASYPGLALTGSACMAGPYDLTGAMRGLMIDPGVHFSRPFFLPYVLLGYNAVYGGPFDPNAALDPALLPDIVQWMDGAQSGDDADTEIERRLGVDPGQVVPRTLMNAGWVAAQLDDGVIASSAVGQTLAANNLWSDWAPNRPMLMLHSPDDDCVPYANSVKTYTEFVRAGVGDLVTFQDLGRPGDGITHVKGAIVGIPTAIIWLKDTCPKD